MKTPAPRRHSEGFLALAMDARKRVQEISAGEFWERKRRGEKFYLVDVREDSEWGRFRIKGAIHLGKGIIERDIEVEIPDKDAPIVCYCGGGYRSALACDSIQKMGYRNVRSLAGGIRGWISEGRPVDK